MRITKTLKRLARRGLLGLVALVCAYVAAGLVGALVPGRQGDFGPGDDVTIHLLRGPIHYDFLLPLDETFLARFGWLALDLDHPGADWIVLGWGGHDFYTTTGTYRDVSARAVWRGVTGDSSVMRLSLAGSFDPDWPVETLHLSKAQYSALLNGIEAGFASRIPLSAPGFSEFDEFYAAHGRFNIFRTCNVWIGETLRAAGIRFGVWTPAPFAVTLSARLWAS